MTTDEAVVIDPTGTDIHGEAERIRAAGPIAPVMLPGGVTAWSVTGRTAAEKVLSDRRFSKDAVHWTAWNAGEVGENFPLLGWVLMENLTTTDGPDHTRMRRLVAHAFTPRRVAAMRTSVEKTVLDVIDELDRAPGAEVVDLKAHFSRAVSSRVICDLLGIPEGARETMLRGGEANVDTTATPEEAAANVERWHREMLDFVAGKRAAPGDDMTSVLVSAHDGSGSLTDNELLGMLHILVATGTEPVMNLVTNAVVELLARPDQLALVRAGAVAWSRVVEETLRHQAPVAHLPFRFTTTEVTVEGITVPAGVPVLVHFAAIGRDPTVAASPEVFDVTREDGGHLSFGHGIHQCIGRVLALLEAETALRELFDRFPDLAIARPGEAQSTFIMNGRAELPVRLRPVAAPGREEDQ